MSKDRHKNLLSFLLSEKFITITVIGSIFTFAFTSSLKNDIIDPFLDFFLPDENFQFMNVILRDGESIPAPNPRKIELKFGSFFKEFVTWISVLFLLFLLTRYTRFPDEPRGNYNGVALM
jgi:large-conductance mechanosensitive channel